jgi:hypothetical protein
LDFAVAFAYLLVILALTPFVDHYLSRWLRHPESMGSARPAASRPHVATLRFAALKHNETVSPDTERFHEQLDSQLGYLKRSCESYDSGHEDEAARLATTLRVLLHTKGRNNVSVLSHLGLQDTSMLTSAIYNNNDWRDLLQIKIDLNSPQPVTTQPQLGDQFNEATFESWWTGEPIFRYEDKVYSRKDVILSMADKDGGAHVDRELEPYYETLRRGLQGLSIVGNLEYGGAEPPFEQGVDVHAPNMHRALVRQFAHEVLASNMHYKWRET